MVLAIYKIGTLREPFDNINSHHPSTCDIDKTETKSNGEGLGRYAKVVTHRNNLFNCDQAALIYLLLYFQRETYYTYLSAIGQGFIYKLILKGFEHYFRLVTYLGTTKTHQISTQLRFSRVFQRTQIHVTQMSNLQTVYCNEAYEDEEIPFCSIDSCALAWTLPTWFSAKHWYSPASELTRPRIRKFRLSTI